VHDDGDARSTMAELLLCCCGATGERRKSKWSRRVGRQARGVLLKSWLAVQGIRGMWQCEQEWHTRAVHCLMTVSHCRSHSDNGNCLTVRLHRFNTANSLVHCKNSVHETCRSTIHLQFLFKDHHLIRHGSEVTSSQSWLDPTENAVRT